MTSYEDDFIKGALEERDRIRKRVMKLKMTTPGSVSFAEVMDIIEWRESNASEKR